MVDAIYFGINKIFLYIINFHLNGAVKHALLEIPLKLLSQADVFPSQDGMPFIRV